ncbi:protein ADM2 [Ochotona curzoniae]|uniref:protein ADM2 n=1 Tax=Ochotona curzoniae TaxID=130825 RepID=UPI001B34D16D|nr:protein ADM2 [Ochotona curzoniae]
MAWLLLLILSCISLVYLQLPAALSSSPRPVRPREPPAWIPASGLQPRRPASWPATWKPRQARQPHRRASYAPSGGQHLKASGPRRPHAQLLRVGCALGTCQVQNLSHRLWQLVRPAGRQDSAPVDPSSPHSYG